MRIPIKKGIKEERGLDESEISGRIERNKLTDREEKGREGKGREEKGEGKGVEEDKKDGTIKRQESREGRSS